MAKLFNILFVLLLIVVSQSFAAAEDGTPQINQKLTPEVVEILRRMSNYTEEIEREKDKERNPILAAEVPIAKQVNFLIGKCTWSKAFEWDLKSCDLDYLFNFIESRQKPAINVRFFGPSNTYILVAKSFVMNGRRVMPRDSFTTPPASIVYNIKDSNTIETLDSLPNNCLAKTRYTFDRATSKIYQELLSFSGSCNSEQRSALNDDLKDGKYEVRWINYSGY